MLNYFIGAGLEIKCSQRFVQSSLLAQLIEFSLMNYACILQSPDVAQAVYGCEWYKMNMKFKIATLHIIRRAQKPIRYHAGALFQINFHTFITVCTIFMYLSIEPIDIQYILL